MIRSAFSSLLALVFLTSAVPQSTFASSTRTPTNSVWFAASSAGLSGNIRLGELHLDDVTLPIELTHHIEKTIFGPISRFSIAPFETSVSLDLDDENLVRWLTPFGYPIVFPKPLLGIYESSEVRIEEHQGDWQMRYVSGLVLDYKAGVLTRLTTPNGTTFDCGSVGQWVCEIKQHGTLVARFQRTRTQWTIAVTDSSSSVAGSVKLNSWGQVIAYQWGGREGTLSYNDEGLLTASREGGLQYYMHAKRPPIWAYEKRLDPTRFTWTVQRTDS